MSSLCGAGCHMWHWSHVFCLSQAVICLSFLLLWASQLVSSKSERRIKVSNMLSSGSNPENYQPCKGGESCNCICMRKGHAEPLLEQSDTRRPHLSCKEFLLSTWWELIACSHKKHSKAHLSSALIPPNHCIELYLTCSFLLPSCILWIAVSLCGHCALYQRQLQN